MIALSPALNPSEGAVDGDEFGEMFAGEFYWRIQAEVVAAQADAGAVAQAVVEFKIDGAIGHFGDDQVVVLGLDIRHTDDVIAIAIAIVEVADYMGS